MRRVLGVVACLVAAAPAMADPQDYSRFVAFGDSLSDSGNYTKNLGLTAVGPGYYPGRFSNGPTWAEILANPSNPSTAYNLFWGGAGSFFSTGLYTGTGNVNAAVGGWKPAPIFRSAGASFCPACSRKSIRS